MCALAASLHLAPPHPPSHLIAGFRDDLRCRFKYNNKLNNYYDKYVERVPYKFVPGIL